MIDLHLHHNSLLLYVLKHQYCPNFIGPDQSYSHFSNRNNFTATHVIFTKCLKQFTATQKIHLKNATGNVSVTFILTEIWINDSFAIKCMSNDFYITTFQMLHLKVYLWFRI